MIQPLLEVMSADVVIFLNSCTAAAAITAGGGGDSGSRTELIVASGVPAPAFGDKLTQFVVEELRRRAEKAGSNALTISSLFNGISKYYVKSGEGVCSLREPDTDLFYSQ